MSVRTVRIVLVAAMAASLSACIDDPAEISDDDFPFTEAESRLLGIELWRDAFEAQQSVEPDTSGIAALAVASRSGEPITFSDSASVSEPCELSGTVDSDVAVEGSLDPDSGVFVLAFAIRQVHQACRQRENGTTYTLFGNPDLEMVFAVGTDGQDSGALGFIRGGVQLVAEGSTAECDIDVAFVELDRADGSSEYELEGMVCGVPVKERVTS